MLKSLEALPRLPLGHLPTPLEPLDRLSRALGGPRLWMKRDDCTGLGTGGNKTRKLEFLLGAASAAGADVVITFGAVQSNHARQTAAACAAQGLECHLLLARKVPWQDPNYETLGNILLDRMFGAHLHLLEPHALEKHYRELRQSLESDGRSCYVIPTGGSNATGALGYAVCAAELTTQAAALGVPLTDIVHATSSAGTQAGLLAGMSLLERLDATRVHGINVSEGPDGIAELEATILRLGNEALALCDAGPEIGREHVRVDSAHIGEGYGLPTETTIDALRQVATLEGILLDPVYSGKAMGGLITGIQAGAFDHASDVVFIHTGGTAALPVYGRAIAG